MSKKATNFPYRLALKLDKDQSGYGRAALAAAVVRLGKRPDGPPEWVGEGATLPPLPMVPSEVSVVVYSRPEDMLEPMPLDRAEQRLAEVLATLPQGIRIHRVQWDATSYQKWRRGRRVADSHQARAEWAGEQLEWAIGAVSAL